MAALAREARDEMQLRHVPLFLVRELARRKGTGPLVAETLEHVIQRADELGEFVALYWKEMKQPLSAGVKRGLARAFVKFDAYQLAKYDRDSAVKLRDVLFLCHAKPRDAEQAAVWKQLVEDKLEAADTWEVSLSARKDKKETFERLLSEGKLGGMAVLRNLRLMAAAGVSPKLIRERLSKGVARALPFRFVTAARYAPKLEDALEDAMLKGISGLRKLPGATGLLVDVSGSMDSACPAKAKPRVWTRPRAWRFCCGRSATNFRSLASPTRAWSCLPRRGFALRDAIAKSQAHSSTYLKRALTQLEETRTGRNLHRLIVITDEQSHDGILPAWTAKAYVVNVAPYKPGSATEMAGRTSMAGPSGSSDYIAGWKRKPRINRFEEIHRWAASTVRPSFCKGRSENGTWVSRLFCLACVEALTSCQHGTLVPAARAFWRAILRVGNFAFVAAETLDVTEILDPLGAFQGKEQFVDIAETVFAAVESDFHFLNDGKAAKTSPMGLSSRASVIESRPIRKRLDFFRVIPAAPENSSQKYARVSAVRINSGDLPALMAITAKIETQRRNSFSPSSRWRGERRGLPTARPSNGRIQVTKQAIEQGRLPASADFR